VSDESSNDEGVRAAQSTASGVISGQFPGTMPWRPDPGGQVRSLEEAIEIARRKGVRIPEDVAFFVDESGELGPTLTARGPEVKKLPGERVKWSDPAHDITGEVPIRIRPEWHEDNVTIRSCWSWAARPGYAQ
jgi:hypothetical protein